MENEEPSSTPGSLHSRTGTPVRFINHSRSRVKLFWLDYQGRQVLCSTLHLNRQTVITMWTRTSLTPGLHLTNKRTSQFLSESPLWKPKSRHPHFLCAAPLKIASKGLKILLALKVYSDRLCPALRVTRI